jgi:hypothetical protein
MAVAVWTAQPRFGISVIPECRRMWNPVTPSPARSAARFRVTRTESGLRARPVLPRNTGRACPDAGRRWSRGWPSDAAGVEQHAEPVVGEGAEAVSGALDLLHQEVEGLCGAIGGAGAGAVQDLGAPAGEGPAQRPRLGHPILHIASPNGNDRSPRDRRAAGLGCGRPRVPCRRVPRARRPCPERTASGSPTGGRRRRCPRPRPRPARARSPGTRCGTRGSRRSPSGSRSCRPSTAARR